MNTAFGVNDSVVDAVALMIEDEDPRLVRNFLKATDYIGGSQSDQIRDLNRLFRRELAGLSVNTISERECLVDDIEPKDWLKYFKSQVLKTVVRFKLPRDNS